LREESKRPVTDRTRLAAALIDHDFLALGIFIYERKTITLPWPMDGNAPGGVVRQPDRDEEENTVALTMTKWSPTIMLNWWEGSPNRFSNGGPSRIINIRFSDIYMVAFPFVCHVQYVSSRPRSRLY
jgi:hypothetical protein